MNAKITIHATYRTRNGCTAVILDPNTVPAIDPEDPRKIVARVSSATERPHLRFYHETGHEAPAEPGQPQPESPYDLIDRISVS